MTATNSRQLGSDRPPPARFALDRFTWKEISHLLVNLPASIVGFVYVVFMIAVGGGLAVTVVGLPLLALGLLGARQIGRFERARARRLLGVRVEEPSPLFVKRGGSFFTRLWMSLKDPVGWRTMLYGFIRLPWGC